MPTSLVGQHNIRLTAKSYCAAEVRAVLARTQGKQLGVEGDCLDSAVT